MTTDVKIGYDVQREQKVCFNVWPVRLSVRSLGFQPGKRGSIPLRATNHRINYSMTEVFENLD